MKWGGAYKQQLELHASSNKFRAACLLEVARALTKSLELEPALLNSSRLSTLAGAVTVDASLANLMRSWATTFEVTTFDDESAALSNASSQNGAAHLRAAHRLGETLDWLLALEKTEDRRRIGSYYTPVNVARTLIGRAMTQHEEILKSCASICDPACGGGAFLLEAAFQLAQHKGEAAQPQGRARIADGVFGVDSSPLAIAVAETALWIFVGDASRALSDTLRFKCADALVGQSFVEQAISLKPLESTRPFHFPKEFAHIFAGPQSGFDWIVGNPPWVAFQGRATQKLSPERRAYYRKYYQAFRGYPTLHGLFIERSAQLAPHGVLTLLVPSSVSDLEGYRFTRKVVETSHQLSEPLLEFGQDAFDGVVQPCFGLIASARATVRPEPAPRAWVLDERGRVESASTHLPAPELLNRFLEGETLPAETFKEMGFQSNRVVATNLFLRSEKADQRHTVALLEGRNVSEFCQRSARLFLAPDAKILSETRCRLRSAEDYQRVDFVVRQTAAFTIAAVHQGERFRNSLIAGFAPPGYSVSFLIALLNSSLFRALHVSRQRDARQVTFPQVKLSHLRRLPAPPASHRLQATLETLAECGTEQGGLRAEQREALDGAVFELFGLSCEQGKQVTDYLQNLAPAALRASIA